jgi:hypothetical protein
MPARSFSSFSLRMFFYGGLFFEIPVKVGVLGSALISFRSDTFNDDIADLQKRSRWQAQ